MRRSLAFALLAAAGAVTGQDGSLLEKYTIREVTGTVLNEDELPELPALLERLNLSHKLAEFHAKQIFETRYIMRLTDMDLRMIGLSTDETAKIKAAASELKSERDVIATRPHPLLLERNALSYGRLYIAGSLSSYEFYLAVFGEPAPLDEGRLVLSEPYDACSPRLTFSGDTRKPKMRWWQRLWRNWRSKSSDDADSAAAGKDPSAAAQRPSVFVVAKRGTCSFAAKARNAAAAGVAALIIVNSNEELFRVAAVLAGPGGEAAAAIEVAAAGSTEKAPSSDDIPEGLAVAMVRASTGKMLEAAVSWGGGEVGARLVPLACAAGAAECAPVLPEEAAMDLPVKSGHIHLLNQSALSSEATSGANQPLDFVSASFGSSLPAGAVRLVLPLQADGCAVASEALPGFVGAALLVQRGGCSFGDKAAAAQAAGARVTIVVDNGESALQPIGATEALAKEVFTPAVFVTRGAGERLAAAAANGGSGGSDVFLSFEADNSVLAMWNELRAAATAAMSEATADGVVSNVHQAVLTGTVTSKTRSDCRAAWAESAMASVKAAAAATASQDEL